MKANDLVDPIKPYNLSLRQYRLTQKLEELDKLIEKILFMESKVFF